MKQRILLQPRKEPQQARSQQMREDILVASIRVLRREGPLRFTTPRVAEAAGISVGSLYQYFPSKHAIVFALHERAVEHAWTEAQRILDHPRSTPRAKVRRLARLFFEAESAEVVEMGSVLRDAEMFFGEQPEHRALDQRVQERLAQFVLEALPQGTPRARAASGAAMLTTVLESVGRAIAARHLPPSRVAWWANATADMLADHLGLEDGRRGAARRRAKRR